MLVRGVLRIVYVRVRCRLLSAIEYPEISHAVPENGSLRNALPLERDLRWITTEETLVRGRAETGLAVDVADRLPFLAGTRILLRL